jgi:hypothetical protein
VYIEPKVYSTSCGEFKNGIPSPISNGMSTNSVNSLSSTYLQQILDAALGGVNNNQSGNLLTVPTTGPTGSQPDNGQLSPFAQIASSLQQLQQSNPTEYQQVTAAIATNLTTAAQTAQTDGNTNAAGTLTQLASDFTSASKNGQLPNLQDLAQATGGTSGHHHHHHHHGGGGSSTGSTTSSTSSSTSGSQSSSLNPLSIIFQTLSSAGITGANG